MFVIRHLKGLYWPKTLSHSLTDAYSRAWYCKRRITAEKKLQQIKDQFYSRTNQERKYNVEFLSPAEFMIEEIRNEKVD